MVSGTSTWLVEETSVLFWCSSTGLGHLAVPLRLLLKPWWLCSCLPSDTSLCCTSGVALYPCPRLHLRRDDAVFGTVTLVVHAAARPPVEIASTTHTRTHTRAHTHAHAPESGAGAALGPWVPGRWGQAEPSLGVQAGPSPHPPPQGWHGTDPQGVGPTYPTWVLTCPPKPLS